MCRVTRSHTHSRQQTTNTHIVRASTGVIIEQMQSSSLDEIRCLSLRCRFSICLNRLS